MVDAIDGSMVSDLQWIDPEQLKIDGSYQRSINDGRVRYIAKNWNHSACGVIYVSMRDDGGLYVIDGHHRVEAAKRAHVDGLPCCVYVGLSQEQEAEVFVRVNHGHGPVKAIDVFRARVRAGDQKALNILTAANNAGVEISRDSGGHSITGHSHTRAVSAIEHEYDRGGAVHLHALLRTLCIAFPGNQKALSAGPIRGLGAFMRHYDDTFDRGRLIDRLSETGINKLQQQAKARASIDGVSVGVAWGMAILACYNHRLATRRLSDW